MGSAVCSMLCGPPCTGRHDLLGVANGLALPSGETRTKAQGLLSSRHSLTPTPVFSGGYFCYPHFTDKQTEVQRGLVTCSRSDS